MEWGPKVEMLLKAQASGMPTPALDNRPSLITDLSWYYECFQDLCVDRLYSELGPQRLSTRTIYDYHRIHGLSDFDDFYGWIRLIDRVWSNLVSEQQKKKLAEKPTSKQSSLPTHQKGR